MPRIVRDVQEYEDLKNARHMSRKKLADATSRILKRYASAFQDPEYSMDPESLSKNHNFLNPAPAKHDSDNYKIFFKSYILTRDYGLRIAPEGKPQLYVAKNSPHLDHLDFAVLDVTSECLMKVGLPARMTLAIHNDGRPVFAGSYDYGIATINIPPSVMDERAKWKEKLEILWKKYLERNAFQK